MDFKLDSEQELLRNEAQKLAREVFGRDQTADYATRRGTPLADIERWLRPNLAYDPED